LLLIKTFKQKAKIVNLITKSLEAFVIFNIFLLVATKT